MTSRTLPAKSRSVADGQKAKGARAFEERIRSQVALYFDEDWDLVHWRYAPDFGAHLVVVDALFQNDFRRVLAALAPDGLLWQQSSMSLRKPEKLVYFYERLMSFALALAGEKRSVLALGLGGGAMARFLGGFFPESRLTIVEKDETIIDIARRWFAVSTPVIAADARSFVAGGTESYDVILVDLYDAEGFVACEPAFWEGCFSRLAPSGCIATRCAALSAHSFSITPKSGKDNLIQFCLGDPGFSIAQVAERLRGFEDRFRRRTNLGRCRIAPVEVA
jgi:hypothetical protein